MKQKFRLYRRGNSGRYYIHDDATGKQTSLHTSDRPTAFRLLHAKNEAVLPPAMNLQIAQVYFPSPTSAREAIAERALVVADNSSAFDKNVFVNNCNSCESTT
jgi:hypothetical protein